MTAVDSSVESRSKSLDANALSDVEWLMVTHGTCRGAVLVSPLSRQLR
jgi:hypothetical protein